MDRRLPCLDHRQLQVHHHVHHLALARDYLAPQPVWSDIIQQQPVTTQPRQRTVNWSDYVSSLSGKTHTPLSVA